MDTEKKSAKKATFTPEQLRKMALEDAILISDRFAREPVLARTGKGSYKSVGVDGLKADVEFLNKLRSNESAQ